VAAHRSGERAGLRDLGEVSKQEVLMSRNGMTRAAGMKKKRLAEVLVEERQEKRKVSVGRHLLFIRKEGTLLASFSLACSAVTLPPRRSDQEGGLGCDGQVLE
jgi:hypothetical protein